MVMYMPSSVDKVEVFTSQLQEIYATLDTAMGYFAALDLADAYRAAKVQTNKSRLAAALERSHSCVEGYLVDAGYMKEKDND